MTAKVIVIGKTGLDQNIIHPLVKGDTVVLAVDRDALSATDIGTLDELEKDYDIVDILIVGGTARVSDAVQIELAKYNSVRRLNGATYDDTNRLVIQEIFPDIPDVVEPPIDPPVEPPVDPPEGVVVTPNDWQSVIGAQGQDAVILFSDGVYTNFGVSPKPGQQFHALPGAAVTLDGGGRSTAFASSKTGSVIIDGRGAAGNRINIRNYSGSFFLGVINNLLSGDWYNDGNNKPDTWLAEGWKVHGVHLTNVGPHGVTLCGTHAELTDFEILGETGRTLEVCWKMLYGYNQLVADGEVANARPTNWGNEGGGSKNWNTTGLVVERVRSHGHTGPGIWHDFNNFESTIRDCEVWDCSGPGLFQEISVESQRVDGQPAGVSIIERNLVRDMRNSSRWGGVEVATSGPVIVRNNTIRNSKAGVWFRDQGGRSPHTGHTAGEVYGNLLDNAGQSGYITESGQGGMVTWHDNEFVNGSTGPG